MFFVILPVRARTQGSMVIKWQPLISFPDPSTEWLRCPSQNAERLVLVYHTLLYWLFRHIPRSHRSPPRGALWQPDECALKRPFLTTLAACICVGHFSAVSKSIHAGSHLSVWRSFKLPPHTHTLTHTYRQTQTQRPFCSTSKMYHIFFPEDVTGQV